MKRALFLYNPESGRGRIGKNVDAIAALFRDSDYQLIPRQIDFQANPFDEEEGLELVVVAGGDGTVNYIVNRMNEARLELPIGVIPAGTANDFARALGMSNDPLEAARQIAQGEETRIDCGCVNGLYFVNVFSFGIFTTTSQRTSNSRKHRIGKLAYLVEGVKEIRTAHAVPLQVKADGKTFDLNSQMVLVFNGETAGGIRLARRSSIRDGLFNVVMLEKRNILSSTLAMGRYLLGGSPNIVHRLQVQRLEIESLINEPTDVDGQPGAEFPLTIECLHGKLRVRCPKEEQPTA